MPRESSLQNLRHEDVVAGNLDGHIWSKESGADFEVAKVAIKGRERRARADDAEVDGLATSKSAPLSLLQMCPSRFPATTSSCLRFWSELSRGIGRQPAPPRCVLSSLSKLLHLQAEYWLHFRGNS